MGEQILTEKKKRFEQVLLEAIDEALSTFGESCRQAIYYYAETRYQIKREEICNKAEAFDNALNDLFEAGGQLISLSIAKSIYERLDLSFKEQSGWRLVDYLDDAKKATGSRLKKWRRTRFSISSGRPAMKPRGKKDLKKRSKASVKGHDILHTTSARTDTTERKQREEALRSSEIRYKELAESISDVFFAMDSDLRYTYWNKASENLTGISAKDALGKSIFDIFPDTEDTRRAVATYREVLKTRQHKSFINEYRLGDKNFVFEISVYPAEDGISIFTKDVTERTRAEEKIKDLARYPSENPNPVLRVSKDGLILHANPASEALLQSWRCKVGEEAPKYWRDILAEVFASQSARNVDVELGEEVILFTVTPVKDASYVNLYGRAITDRKRMEEELRKSEERFRSLVENTSDWIWETDANGIYTYSSPKVKDLLGYDPKGVVGKTPFDFMPPKEARRVGAKFADLVKNKESFSGLENINLHKDGREVELETSAVPILDSNGKLLGYRGIDRDVTDRKRMETELKRHTQHIEELVETRTGQLKESEERHRLLIDNMTDTVFTIDLKGKITFCSQAGEKMTGYPVQQLLSMNMKEVIAQEHLAEIQESLQARIRGEKNLPPHEFEIIRADGKLLPVEMSTTPLVKKGSLVGIQGIARDITERKEMDRLREQATTNLIEDAVIRKELEKMKNQFIFAVTHELRTPLVSIKGYLDLTLEGSESMTENVQSNLHVVKRNTDRLLSLVDDLLDLSRMQAGRLRLELQPMDFKTVIQSCMAEAEPLIEEKKLSVGMEVPEKPLPIQGDQVRLCEVLMNLLSNATKFSPEGSDVTLRVEEENKSIKVQVSDRGIGIRKEDLARVFEPFSAIEKPTYIKGAGLGLSITKGFVEAHGGRIWAESEGEGKGATFSFTIPKRKEGV